MLIFFCWSILGMVPLAVAVFAFRISYLEIKNDIKHNEDIFLPALMGFVGVLALVPTVVCFLAAFGVV